MGYAGDGKDRVSLTYVLTDMNVSQMKEYCPSPSNKSGVSGTNANRKHFATYKQRQTN